MRVVSIPRHRNTARCLITTGISPPALGAAVVGVLGAEFAAAEWAVGKDGVAGSAGVDLFIRRAIAGPADLHLTVVVFRLLECRPKLGFGEGPLLGGGCPAGSAGVATATRVIEGDSRLGLVGAMGIIHLSVVTFRRALTDRWEECVGWGRSSQLLEGGDRCTDKRNLRVIASATRPRCTTDRGGGASHVPTTMKFTKFLPGSWMHLFLEGRQSGPNSLCLNSRKSTFPLVWGKATPIAQPAPAVRRTGRGTTSHLSPAGVGSSKKVTIYE